MTPTSPIEILAMGLKQGRMDEREKITAWLRNLDRESGDINRFLPSTLANWIEEGMHDI